MKEANIENVSEERCSVCNRLLSEYDSSWSCKKNHHWRKNWAKDKTTDKYKQFQEKRNKSMQKAWRKWLDKLNKKTPPEYASRRRCKILDEIKVIKRRRTQYRSIVEKDIKI